MKNNFKIIVATLPHLGQIESMKTNDIAQGIAQITEKNNKIESLWAKSRQIREQIEAVAYEDGATDELGAPVGEYKRLVAEFNAVCDEADALVGI